MPSGKKNLVVNNRILLNPIYPIPIQYNSDSFAFVQGKEYIPFLNPQDNFPMLMLEARLTSVTQNACITSITASAIGNGITILMQKSDGDQVTVPDPDLIKWMKTVNNKNDSFDDIMHECVDAERGSGNVFIEVVKGIINKVPFMKIYVHPLVYCRFGPEDPKTGFPTEVIISKYFSRRGFRRNLKDARRVPLWSANALDQKNCWVKATDGTLRTMLHFKNSYGGVDHYGLPASISGLRAQVLEGKMEQFNLDNLDNNMILGGMLILNSSMTPEEADENAQRIINSHTGQGNNAKIAVISSEGGISDVNYVPYTTQTDGSFKDYDGKVEEKIIKANNWNGVFFGLGHGGALGNGSNYVRSAWDVAETEVLNPLRRKLLDKVVVPLMMIYADVYNKPEILKYDFWFKSAKPFSFLADMDPSEFMKVNEARELSDLPADETKKDVYLSEMNSNKNVPNQPASQKGANNP